MARKGEPMESTSLPKHGEFRWKEGWSFYRDFQGGVIIKAFESPHSDEKVIAETRIPGTDWIKIIAELALSQNQQICKEIMRALHAP